MSQSTYKLASNRWFTLEQAIQLINNHQNSKFKLTINNLYELFANNEIGLFLRIDFDKNKLVIPNSNIFLDDFLIEDMKYLRCEMLDAENKECSINKFYGHLRMVRNASLIELLEKAVFTGEPISIDTEHLNKLYFAMVQNNEIKLVKFKFAEIPYCLKAEIASSMYIDIDNIQTYINSLNMRNIESLGYLDMKDLRVNDSKEYYFGIMRDYALDLKSENPQISYAELYRRSKAFVIEKLGLKKDVYVYTEKRFREKFKAEEKDVFL